MVLQCRNQRYINLNRLRTSAPVCISMAAAVRSTPAGLICLSECAKESRILCTSSTLSKVGSLKSVEEQPDKGIRIGCMVSLTQLLSPYGRQGAVPRRFTKPWNPLGRCRSATAGPWLATYATRPLLRTPSPPCSASDCTVNVRHSSGLRNIPLDSLITGPGQISLAVGEFVESIDLPYSGEDQASAYVRIGRRKAVDCSIGGCGRSPRLPGQCTRRFWVPSRRNAMRIKSVEDMLRS